MKKFFAIAIMAMVLGLGSPAAFADGNAEAPGATDDTKTTLTVEGNAEAPGYLGSAESPGFMTTALIYLSVIL